MLFDDELLWRSASQSSNPYGDGQACGRIVDVLMGRPVDEFVATPTARRSEATEALHQSMPLRSVRVH
jgi:UDP-N-acetylglucosamine 2-epimerase (non-hydrolysing)